MRCGRKEKALAAGGMTSEGRKETSEGKRLLTDREACGKMKRGKV